MVLKGSVSVGVANDRALHRSASLLLVLNANQSRISKSIEGGQGFGSGSLFQMNFAAWTFLIGLSYASFNINGNSGNKNSGETLSLATTKEMAGNSAGQDEENSEGRMSRVQSFEEFFGPAADGSMCYVDEDGNYVCQ